MSLSLIFVLESSLDSHSSSTSRLSRLIDVMVALTADWNVFVPLVVSDFEDDDEPVAFVA